MLIPFLSMSSKTYGQILYEENFDLPGEGVIGPQPTTFSIPTGAWSLSGDFSGLTASSDYVLTMTDAGESFLEAQDTDEIICFESDPIDISSYDSVGISALLSEEGDLETSDFFDVFLWVDGTETLLANYQNLGSSTHTLTGDKPNDDDFGEVEIQETLTGNILILKICFKNNAGTEQLRIKQVKVEAFSTPEPVPLPDTSQASFSLINAISDQPFAGFDPISDGASIDLLNLHTPIINFRYNASPDADEVKIGISRGGQTIERIDKDLPFSLFGDYMGNYRYPSWSFFKLLWLSQTGSLHLYAFEYADGNKLPIKETKIHIDLFIGPNQLKEAISIAELQFELYPNPASTQTLLQLDPRV
ncbi:MAG: hypothetical protein AAFR87_02620, partial [Bacteroidota bacterium]